MNVAISSEQRFDRTPDGTVWAPGAYAYASWLRYLDVFDHVSVVARLRDVPEVPQYYGRSSGKNVEFVTIPYYVGSRQFLASWRKISRAAQKAIGRDGAVILRIPSTIASCMYPTLREQRHPYGVEVIGDPREVFAPGVVRHPLRPVLRRFFSVHMRRECADACAAAYVTREALQGRYPCGGRVSAISDVVLPSEAFVTDATRTEAINRLFARPAHASVAHREVRLVSVGSLEQMYKGPDVLMDAIGELAQEGWDLQLVWIGDGRYRRHVEARCDALSLGGRVRFAGQLDPGDTLRAQLDIADLFVLPSRTEGLPRAMLEAMARGLPCIGSNVGGIPELLPPEDLVPPGNAKALAAKIREVITHPSRMDRMAVRNLEKAREYREEILRERRIAFCQFVQSNTEAWLRTCHGGR